MCRRACHYDQRFWSGVACANRPDQRDYRTGPRQWSMVVEEGTMTSQSRPNEMKLSGAGKSVIKRGENASRKMEEMLQRDCTPKTDGMEGMVLVPERQS